MIYEPTMQLRFVRRPIDDNQWATTLQQKFVVTPEYGFTADDWRDVPVEEDEVQKP